MNVAALDEGKPLPTGWVTLPFSDFSDPISSFLTTISTRWVCEGAGSGFFDVTSLQSFAVPTRFLTAAATLTITTPIKIQTPYGILRQPYTSQLNITIARITKPMIRNRYLGFMFSLFHWPPRNCLRRFRLKVNYPTISIIQAKFPVIHLKRKRIGQTESDRKSCWLGEIKIISDGGQGEGGGKSAGCEKSG